MADLRMLNISTEELSKATNPFHVDIKDIDLMRIDEAYPQLLVQEVMSEFNQQTNEYVVKQLVSLNIDKDVLLKQTQEIQRLNYKIAELQEQIPKWHLAADGDLPSDARQVLVYGMNYHFVIGKYAEMRTEKGYEMKWVKSDAWSCNEELKKVIAWTELPEFEGVE